MAIKKTMRKPVATSAGKKSSTMAKATAPSRSNSKTMSKSAMKSASKTATAPKIAAVKKAKAAQVVWPQAKSSSGAVSVHSTVSSAKPVAVTGERAAPDEVAPPWLAPWGNKWGDQWGQWGQMGATATRMVAPDVLKAAFDRQFQLCQSMARFSPLTLALQMMQGLLPDDHGAASTRRSHRS